MAIVKEALSQNLYFDRQANINAVKILPGEYFVTQQEMMLVTVLGSCVAACIRDTTSGVGGMNHFMLPNSGGNEKESSAGASARYGSYAMELLINELLKLGAKRSNLEAKVFGGGAVLKGFTTGNVGQRNAEFVLNFLRTENIRVVAQDLLDIYPRRVHYYPHTGKVLVKKLRDQESESTKLLSSESEYSRKINSTKQISGEIELFG